MENTLKETEWLTINKVLLEMYDITDIDQFTERVLKTYRMLIPYTKGYFIVFNEAGGIESKKSSFIEKKILRNSDSARKTLQSFIVVTDEDYFGDDAGVYEEYLDSYYEKDYMKYTFELSEHTITYRDTDIMEESLRQKTEFYQGFLKPNHIPFGAGILLRRYGKPIGIVNFFRSELLGDFSDKDMFILEVLKGHLSHKLAGLLNGTKQAAGNRNKMLAHLAAEFELSEREKEALTCMDGGMTNAQIAENMGISLSTVKKHVYHIFEKVGVDTRAQLRNVLETYNSTKF